MVHKLKNRGEPVMYQGYGEILSLVYSSKRMQYQLAYEITGRNPTASANFAIYYLTPEQLEAMTIVPLKREDGKIISWEMQ